MASTERTKHRPEFRDNTFTMGYDAEVVFHGPENAFIPALNLLSDPTHQSGVGLDGVTDVAELRGVSSQNPLDIVQDIGNHLRNEMPEAAKMFAIKAGAFPSGHPVGFHIHFGIGQTQILQRAIESTVGMLLMLIEPRPDGKRRCDVSMAQPPYGAIDAWTQKPYGCEYKMPWSFIITPDLTLTILTFAKLMAYLCGPGNGDVACNCKFDANNFFGNKDANLRDVYNDRNYKFAREWLLQLVNRVQDEEAIEKALQTHFGDDFSFRLTRHEIKALANIETMVKDEWIAAADVDLRKTWAMPNEAVQFIFPETVDMREIAKRITLVKSLNPVYVRQSRAGRDLVLSTFEGNQLKKLVPALKEAGFDVGVMKTLQSIHRCCPTINVGKTIATERPAEVAKALNIVKQTMEEK